MEDLIKTILESPVANLFIVAGIVFLGIAVVGNISGKIQPGTGGRILSALLGLVLLGGGLWMHSNAPREIEKSIDVTSTVAPVDISSVVVSAPTVVSASFRVIETFLRADLFDYSGVCPVTITFSGRISVAGDGGTVSYKWIRNDGASAPVETLMFDGPGSKDISTTWSIGGSGMNYSGWQAIEVFDPQSQTSDHADFIIKCD